MISSWLRRLVDNRFKGASRRPRQWPTRLEVEVLETRTVPTVVFWTGNDVGLGSPGWSDPGNWFNGVVPQNFDDVVFGSAAHPIPLANRNFETGTDTAEVPKEGIAPYNSVNDIGNLTLNTLTIGIDGMVIDGNAITLKSDLVASSDFSTGVSLIHNDIHLLLNPQHMVVQNSGATLILAGSLSDASGTSGLLKEGPGTLMLSNSITDVGDAAIEDETLPDDVKPPIESKNNSFTGVVEVAAGTLDVLSPFSLGSDVQGTIVDQGATLRVSGTTITTEALALTGDGVGGEGALLGGPGQFLQDGEEGFPLRLVEDWQNTFTNGLPGKPAPTYSGPITLTPNASIGVLDGDGDGNPPPTIPPVEVILTLDGGISGGKNGGGNLTKVGGGTLSLPKDNTYAGVTDIKQGTVSVSSGANNALSEGSSTLVEAGATLDFQGTLTVDEPIMLKGDGDKDFTGGVVGALTTTGNTNTNVTLTGPVTLLTPASIGGDDGSTLTIKGDLSGTGDLKKIGLSTLILPNANLGFTGNTIIGDTKTGGTLIIEDPQALGPVVHGGVITVNNPGTLELMGSFNIGKTLTLNGQGFAENSGGGALKLVGGASTIDTWSGPIHIASSTSIAMDPNSQLTVTGIIDGAARDATGSLITLEKDGTGTLVLAAANTYLGPTTLRDGTTIIKDPRSLGGAGGFGTTVAAGATLQMGGGLNLADEDLTLTGSGVGGIGALHVTDGNNIVGGSVNLSKTPPVLVNTDAGTQMTFTNVVSGSAPLEKGGGGTLTLTGSQANTATGGALVDDGLLLLSKAANIQALAGDTTVGNGIGNPGTAVLRLTKPNQIADTSNITVLADGLFDLNGNNEAIRGLNLTAGHVTTGSAGTLTLGGDVTTSTANGLSSDISGNLSLGSGTRTFTTALDPSNIDDLIVDAIISVSPGSSAGLIKDGPGTLRLNASNTYPGPTSVVGGTLKLGLNNAIVTNSILSLTAPGTFDLNNFSQTVSELSGSGTLKLGSGTFTEGDAATTTFSGKFSGPGNVIKVGSGTLIASGDSSATFSGSTDVQAGTLQVDGKLGTGVVTVEAKTTLAGNKGTVGGITDQGGTVSPGDSGPGKLTSAGSVSFNSSSTFRVEINGITAGTSYDQLSVTSTATLGGAKLVTSFGYNAAVGDSYVIVHTTAGVSGTFTDPQGNPLAEGATFTDNGRVFQISYAANGGKDVQVTMVAFQSTVSLASSQNPSTIGQAVTFTATIGVLGAPNRTGTVTFFDGNTPLGAPVNVSNNQAQLTTSTLAGGTRAINATYSGDTNFQMSNGVLNPPQVVNKINSSTSLTSDKNPVDYGVSYTFTATVTASSGSSPFVPSGDVTFVDTTTGNTLGVRTLDGTGKAKLTVDGSSVAFLDAGLHSIKASFPGDNNFTPSSGAFTQTVNQVSTSTSVTVDSSSSVYGEPRTYTATVTSPTVTPFGSVTFTANDGMGHTTAMGTQALDSNGKAVLTFNGLPVGTQTVTGTFNANVDFKSSSGTTTETVSQGTTSASLSTSKSPTVFGEPVTFTATISANAPSTLSPGGSVTFIDTTTNTTLGTSNLSASGSGQSTAMLTVKTLSSAVGGMTHTIQANYNTDGNYATSSATTDQTVNPAPTVTTVTVAPSPSVFGQVVTITATINPSPSVAVPTGSVVFTIDGNQTGPVSVNSNGQAQFQIAFTKLGSHTIAAAYTSNNANNFQSSSSGQVTQQVNAAPTAVVVSSSQPTAQVGRSVTFTATVTAPLSTVTPNSGTVTFFIDGASQATVSINGSGQAAFSTSSLSPGSHTVTARFNSGSPNFLDGQSGPLAQRIHKDYFLIGQAPGGTGEIRIFDATTGALLVDANIYPGGVNVAAGDLNGDGVADMVFAPATGPGAVMAFDGATFAPLAIFSPYGPGYAGGVNVAVADLFGAGHGNIVTGVGGATPAGFTQVAVFGLGFPLGFNVYDPSFAGGVRLGAGDLEGAGRDDLVVAPGPGTIGGAAPSIVLVSAVYGVVPLFAPYGGGMTAGVFVALGDINGDGHADIITGPGAGSTQVDVFSGATLGPIQTFAAYPGSAQGVRVGTVDRNGDGRADIITMPATGAPPGGRIVDGLTLADLDAFFFFSGTFPGAAAVAGSV